MNRPRKNQQAKSTDSLFKQLRLNAKLSQEALAKDINVAVSTIRRWEKGNVEPTFTVAQMKAFCDSANIPLSDLPNKLSIDKQENRR